LGDLPWSKKLELPSLPNIRVGFVFVQEYSESVINRVIAKSILNLIYKLIIVVASEKMTNSISQSIERNLSKSSILQLRKYLTVLTPSTLVDKPGVLSSGHKNNSIAAPEDEEVT
jgi:hypothetical protein